VVSGYFHPATRNSKLGTPLILDDTRTTTAWATGCVAHASHLPDLQQPICTFSCNHRGRRRQPSTSPGLPRFLSSFFPAARTPIPSASWLQRSFRAVTARQAGVKPCTVPYVTRLAFGSHGAVFSYYPSNTARILYLGKSIFVPEAL
jgi:hypothetical protein